MKRKPFELQLAFVTNALRPMGKATVEPVRATAFPIRNLGARKNG